MKVFHFFLLLIILCAVRSNAQYAVMLGNQSDCEQTGFGPSEFSCKKYLTAENGSLTVNYIPSEDNKSMWEIISNGAVENEEELFYIKNLSSGKYLCAEDGIPQCSASDGSKPEAQWGLWETDVATGIYYIVNRSNSEMLVTENGGLKFSNNETAYSDAARFDSKYNTYRWVTVEPAAKKISPTDPGMVVTDPTSANVVSDEAAAILERHNYWRSQLGIAPLAWSDELAAYAQDWADQLSAKGCNLEHRKNGKYGENLYWAMGGNLSGVDAVNSWADERKDFDFNTQEGTGGVVGHYTQMIWENTTKVGCAMVKCSDGSVIWVCNYDPPGNYAGQKPWKK
ncbi:MAG: RICIN domain-containing protein [Bacteroidetes bacterium]|nr:RICIN domain-containing protein [Bacteroidota bacterium]